LQQRMGWRSPLTIMCYDQSDVLAPLHSILVALIQFRKQAAQRLLQAYHEACNRAEAGEALPLRFQYEDDLAEINHGARTVAEFRVEKRHVVLEFTLWNRRTWIKHHLDEVSARTRENARLEAENYAPEKDQYFVEHTGKAADLLWVGDLIEHGILMHLDGLRKRSHSETFEERDRLRLAYARALGVSKGFTTGRPGLLTPAGGFGQWLALTIQRSGAPIFDPECLCRGTLFGAALATLALTNGSRVSELLQISADRFKAHPYEEKKDGQPTGKQRIIWLQLLLPKGKRTEEERQLFPVSPQSYELLREIGTYLTSKGISPCLMQLIGKNSDLIDINGYNLLHSTLYC